MVLDPPLNCSSTSMAGIVTVWLPESSLVNVTSAPVETAATRGWNAKFRMVTSVVSVGSASESWSQV